MINKKVFLKIYVIVHYTVSTLNCFPPPSIKINLPMMGKNLGHASDPLWTRLEYQAK